MVSWLMVRGLSEEKVYVDHEPYSARYRRAEEQLGTVLYYGLEIGRYEEPDAMFFAGKREVGEVVVWVKPLNPKECGYYCVFKVIEYQNGMLEAQLFCFYDGTFNSPKIKTEAMARSYMKKNYPKYVEVKND